MNKLIGEFRHSLDLKKRFFVPADMRISTSWIITAGLDECLFLFPENEWEKITENVKNLPMTKRDARSFLRVFLSRARYLTTDAQGRLLIPDNLFNYAGLSRECVIIGMLNRVEIWNPQKWEKYSSSSEKNFVEIAENLEEFGL